MWLLVNPHLNEEIDAATMLQFVRSLAEIAILQTRKRIEGAEPQVSSSSDQHYRDQCLSYLNRAE